MSQTPPDPPVDHAPPPPAPDPVARWLSALTRGINTATVARAGIEALVVVGGTLVLLSILLVPVLAALDADAGSGSQVDLGAGVAVRAAAVLLGLAAFGRLAVDLEAANALYQGSGSASLALAPLTITAVLVLGFAVAARARPRRDVRHHVQSSVLAGVAAGALLAVISAAAATDAVPGLDTETLLGVRFHAGVGPWRVLATGTLLAALSGFVPRTLAHARAGWGGRGRPWLVAVSTALRFVLVGGVLAVLAVVALLLVDALPLAGAASSLPGAGSSGSGDGANDTLVGALVVAAFLPNLAGVLVGLATGTSATASATVTGQGASLLQSEDVGPGGLHRSFGLWSRPGEGVLWLALAVALLVLAVVAVRGALLRDPREPARGDWWRTGVVFAVLAVIGVWVTGGSGAVTLGPASAFGVDTGGATGSALAGGSLGGVAGRAGLSLLGAVTLAFGLGALVAVVQQRAVRPTAGALPGLVASAGRLPGGVHPLWALLLVDACARLGRRHPARLVEAARDAASEADGLEPLTVDTTRSTVALATLTAVVTLVVVVPVVLLVLSATVFGPGAAARSYADALRSGDAAALREAAGGGSGPALTDAALAAQRSAAPITDVRTVLDASGGEPTASVAFRVGGAEHVQQVILERSPDKVWGVVTRWRARASLPRVAVAAPGSSGVEVNGQEVSTRALAASQGSVMVFPGEVTVVPSVGPQLTSTTWKGVAADDAPAAQASFRYDLDPAARDEAEKAVASWLARCAASSQLEPPGCPAQVAYPNGTDQSGVRWEYGEPTDLDIAPDPDSGQVRAEGHVDARATYDYTYGYLGYSSTSSSESTTARGSVPFSGTVTYRGGSATFLPDGLDYG